MLEYDKYRKDRDTFYMFTFYMLILQKCSYPNTGNTLSVEYIIDKDEILLILYSKNNI